MAEAFLEAMAKEKGGNVFWIIMISLAVVGLFYLALWGFAENNFRAITIAIIFAMMLIFSVAFLGKNLFLSEEPLAKIAVAFWAGFLAWTGLTYVAQIYPQSIMGFFSIEPQAMLSSVAQQIPQFWNFFITVWMAATIEELTFLLTIPVLIFLAMRGLGRYFSLLANKVVQITFVIIISSLTFAFFHTGQAMFVNFVVAACIFRGIQLGLYWGDSFWDVIPFTTVLASFAVGAHMANNWMTIGFMRGVNIMMSEPFGWVLLGVLAMLVVIPIASLKK